MGVWDQRLGIDFRPSVDTKIKIIQTFEVFHRDLA